MCPASIPQRCFVFYKPPHAAGWNSSYGIETLLKVVGTVSPSCMLFSSMTRTYRSGSQVMSEFQMLESHPVFDNLQDAGNSLHYKGLVYCI